jgi:hypothetical protein
MRSAVEWINEFPKIAPHIKNELDVTSEVTGEIWLEIISALENY